MSGESLTAAASGLLIRSASSAIDDTVNVGQIASGELRNQKFGRKENVVVGR